MATTQALDLAAEAGLQLVEVNPKANPPVCKIMDYGKFKYESAKREREAKKNQKTIELKEVKFRPKTHGHDFDFKLRHVRRFLGDGDKVKLVVQFRGREVTHPETGRAILDRVCKGAADIASVIQMAQMEGNRMNMVLAPKREAARVIRTQPLPRPATAPPPRRPAEVGIGAEPRVGGIAGELDPEKLDEADDDDEDDDDLDMTDDTTGAEDPGETTVVDADDTEDADGVGDTDDEPSGGEAGSDAAGEQGASSRRAPSGTAEGTSPSTEVSQD